MNKYDWTLFLIVLPFVLIFTLMLSGCASVETRHNIVFECNIFNFHGSYIKLTTESSSEESAERQAEIVRLKLVKKDLIPGDTQVSCNKSNDLNTHRERK